MLAYLSISVNTLQIPFSKAFFDYFELILDFPETRFALPNEDNSFFHFLECSLHIDGFLPFKPLRDSFKLLERFRQRFFFHIHNSLRGYMLHFRLQGSVPYLHRYPTACFHFRDTLNEFPLRANESVSECQCALRIILPQFFLDTRESL